MLIKPLYHPKTRGAGLRPAEDLRLRGSPLINDQPLHIPCSSDWLCTGSVVPHNQDGSQKLAKTYLVATKALMVKAEAEPNDRAVIVDEPKEARNQALIMGQSANPKRTEQGRKFLKNFILNQYGKMLL